MRVDLKHGAQKQARQLDPLLGNPHRREKGALPWKSSGSLFTPSRSGEVLLSMLFGNAAVACYFSVSRLLAIWRCGSVTFDCWLRPSIDYCFKLEVQWIPSTRPTLRR